MSCGYRSFDYWRFWIVSTLLGVSVCVPIASLPVFSQSYPVLSPLAAPSSDMAATSSGATSAPANSEPISRKLTPCNGAHPVSCVYANRDWVSHLEQELGTANPLLESPPDAENNTETVNSGDRPAPTTAQLRQRIRLLTQLKVWLDAVP